MFKKPMGKILLALVLAGPAMVVAEGSAADRKTEGLKMDKVAVSDIDRDFVVQASLSSNSEIELSQLALQTSKNDKVRYFAEMMVKDHTAANKDLKAVSATKEVILPKGIDAEHKKALDTLAKQPNTAFDTAYMDRMVADHDKAVALFQRQAQNGVNADLKAYAARTLPHLQHHQRVAREIRERM